MYYYNKLLSLLLFNFIFYLFQKRNTTIALGEFKLRRAFKFYVHAHALGFIIRFERGLSLSVADPEGSNGLVVYSYSRPVRLVHTSARCRLHRVYGIRTEADKLNSNEEAMEEKTN